MGWRKSISIRPCLEVVSRIFLPIDVGNIYIGIGDADGLRPGPWCNPFVRLCDDAAVAVLKYEEWLRARMDLEVFLNPLFGAGLLCDCGNLEACHGRVLQDLCQELIDQYDMLSGRDAGSGGMSCDDDVHLCKDAQEDSHSSEDTGSDQGTFCCDGDVHMRMDAQKVDVTGGTETTCSSPASRALCASEEWRWLATALRSSSRRVFLVVFSGSGILTRAFADAGWCTGPPVDIVTNGDFDLLNPMFLAVLIGLLLEGRVALLHLAPPCASFSMAVNRHRRHAMRSWEYPGGLPDLRQHQELKVRMGNDLADVSIRLIKAQVAGHGSWQLEQPASSLM